MRAEDRTRLAIKILGWQGGTIHQVCETFGVKVNNFLYDSAEEVGVINSPFSHGWFAVRTCPLDYVRKTLIPRHRGNLQFVFGMLAGENLKEQGI